MTTTVVGALPTPEDATDPGRWGVVGSAPACRMHSNMRSM